MNTKSICITIAVLAGTAGLISLFDRGTPADSAESSGPAIKPETVESATRIVLSAKGGESVELQRSGDAWVVANATQTPASLSSLQRLADSLIGLEVERFVSSRPETLSRLQLGQQSVSLFDGDTEMARIDKGDSADGGGFYARLSGREGAWLLRGSLFVQTDESAWTAKQPLEIDAETVARVETPLKSDEVPLTFERANGGGWKLVDAPEGYSVQQEAIDRLVTNLVSLRFTSMKPKGDTDAAEAASFEKRWVLQDESGHRHFLWIGRRPEQATGSAGEDGEPETQPAGPVYARFNVVGKDTPWDRAFDANAFELSSWQFDRLPKEAADLIDEPSAPAPAPAFDDEEATDAPEGESVKDAESAENAVVTDPIELSVDPVKTPAD